MKTGVVGLGVVGGALFKALKQKGFEVYGYDKFKPEYQSLDFLKADILFVCVPTPTESGRQDISCLHDVLSKLESENFAGIVVIKSTVLPGTTDELQKIYNRLTLASNPEFVTAASPLKGMIDQPAILIGTNDIEIAAKLKEFWKKFDVSIPTRTRPPKATELAKYMHNCFLATKVIFFNHMFDIAEKIGIPYTEAVSMAHMIGQIGEGHTKVPGPDGERGYGGMCFPKDMEALSGWCASQNIPTEVINGAISANQRMRP